MCSISVLQVLRSSRGRAATAGTISAAEAAAGTIVSAEAAAGTIVSALAGGRRGSAARVGDCRGKRSGDGEFGLAVVGVVIDPHDVLAGDSRLNGLEMAPVELSDPLRASWLVLSNASLSSMRVLFRRLDYYVQFRLLQTVPSYANN